MGIQATTANFIKEVAAKARLHVAVQILEGDYDLSKNKLAVDYISPAISSDTQHRYGIALVARVRCLNVATDLITERPVRIEGYFTLEQVLSGPANWPIHVEAIAYNLVQALKITLREINRAELKLIPEGDYYKAAPNVNRVWT